MSFCCYRKGWRFFRGMKINFKDFGYFGYESIKIYYLLYNMFIEIKRKSVFIEEYMIEFVLVFKIIINLIRFC